MTITDVQKEVEESKKACREAIAKAIKEDDVDLVEELIGEYAQEFLEMDSFENFQDNMHDGYEPEGPDY